LNLGIINLIHSAVEKKVKMKNKSCELLKEFTMFELLKKKIQDIALNAAHYFYEGLFSGGLEVLNILGLKQCDNLSVG
jgi:hypothetical protein